MNNFLPCQPRMRSHACVHASGSYTVVALPFDFLFKRIFICSALFILLLSISFFSNAQDALMGLTSNGGPQGKGTAFTIKTNGTGFAIVKGFADWGKESNGWPDTGC